MGMQRLSQILNRNSEKLLSVSLLLELGAVKAFSWAMGSLWNSTANLQTHSGYQRKEESSSLCKASQETLYFHHKFHHLGPHKHSMGWKYRNLAITKSYLLSEAIKRHQYCITVQVEKGRLSFCKESICCGKPYCGKTKGSLPGQRAWSTIQQTSWKSAMGPLHCSKNHDRTQAPSNITPRHQVIAVRNTSFWLNYLS